MSDIHSTVTELPLSCKSAAERMSKELEKESSYANITASCRQKITNLEKDIEKETGEKVALVAYRV